MSLCKSVFIILLVLANYTLSVSSAQAQVQVNLPNFGTNSRMNEAAIFWFGQVDNHQNYADVRAGYTNTDLKIYLHIMDRYLWYNPTPNPADFANWDSVSLYLSTSLTPGPAISSQDYLFQGQLNWWENDLDYQSGFQGNANHTWTPLNLPLITESGWRGNAPNDLVDDRGWTMFFTLPFSVLNSLAPPPEGTTWHLGLILHDRDNNTTPPEPTQSWPPGFNAAQPSSWGTIHFGLPQNSTPSIQNPSTYIIRQDNNHEVVDAHVGGHGDCGGDSGPDFFPTWGSKNYAGYTQITEQNQWDIADWPCFSKMYFKFPLSSLPPGKVVTQATLTLHQFGNSDPSLATPSYLQILTTSPSWDENTITWNNAPEALENVAIAKVDPVSGTIIWPGWQREWDVTYGVASTYTHHQTTFAFSVYSADGDYHSGKYFTSSDIEDWDLVGRPTLTLTLADPLTSIPGDFNQDGLIDRQDFQLFISQFNTPNPKFNFLGSSLIDIFDFNHLLNFLGR
jgi:hypothetical protein